MKSYLKHALMCAVVGVFFVCAGAVSAQMVGGYKAAPVDNEMVVAAAEFAVSNYSENNEVSLILLDIHKAERQTVQGANYRLCIEVGLADEGNEDVSQFVQIVVYQDLKRNYKLTKWEPDACGE